MDKHFYNEASAKKLGWEPSWFGEKYFDDKLVRAIKKWQLATTKIYSGQTALFVLSVVLFSATVSSLLHPYALLRIEFIFHLHVHSCFLTTC